MQRFSALDAQVFNGIAHDLTRPVTTRLRGMDHRPHIVVVEDEATQRQVLVDYLTRQNFRVSGVDGGSALRKLVERELPELVPT
jgi:PleD family two-component response regulator